MNTPTTAFARRNDLDALRAFAMLLGIVLHASLSFFASFWMVSDRRQSPIFGVLFSAIHGFRMPLFFVMCGFFSAMLLHRRGRMELVKHRFKRVFLPLLLGMVTIVPLTMWVSAIAMAPASKTPANASPTRDVSNIWLAARAGDIQAIERHLASGTAVDAVDPEHGGTPLIWAAATYHPEVVELLAKRGANVNAIAGDGGTALHAAAFLGDDKGVEVLIRHGANVNAPNKTGNTPLDVAVLDEGTTRYFAGVLQLELNEDGLARRKAAVADSLREHGAIAGAPTRLTDILMQMPLFNHLWFLWFLWWLVVGYAALSAIGAWLPSIRVPAWLVLSPARYLWLVPLTMIPQAYMGNGGTSPIFGPDSSAGPLPIPHIFAYYAIFFGFGALYFRFDDESGRVGERWWLPLSLALGVVFPIGLALLPGGSGFAAAGMGDQSRRVLTIFLLALYPWLMTFGLMGVFRRLCAAESPRIRYLSDSAYWLYLAHLPLVVAAQHLVRDWPMPAVVKFSLIVVVSTAFLLWTYQTTVRYTWLGRFLNGPRARPVRVESLPEAAAPAVAG